MVKGRDVRFDEISSEYLCDYHDHDDDDDSDHDEETSECACCCDLDEVFEADDSEYA